MKSAMNLATKIQIKHKQNFDIKIDCASFKNNISVVIEEIDTRFISGMKQ
jgi:hypothetical protein